MEKVKFYSDKRFGTVRVIEGATPMYSLSDVALLAGLDGTSAKLWLGRRGTIRQFVARCMAFGGLPTKRVMKQNFIYGRDVKKVLDFNHYRDTAAIYRWLMSEVAVKATKKPKQERNTLEKANDAIARSVELLYGCTERHKKFLETMKQIHEIERKLIEREDKRVKEVESWATLNYSYE